MSKIDDRFRRRGISQGYILSDVVKTYVGTLDGDNDYIQFDSALIPATGDFTFSFDFRPNTLTSSNRWLCGIWDGTNNTAFYVGIDDNSFDLIVLGYNRSYSGNLSNGWHNFEMIRSGDDWTFNMDGALWFTRTISGSFTTNDMYFGRLSVNETVNFGGRLKNIKVEGSHWFKINEGSGTTLNDSIGSGLGTVGNATTTAGQGFWANEDDE